MVLLIAWCAYSVALAHTRLQGHKTRCLAGAIVRTSNLDSEAFLPYLWETSALQPVKHASVSTLEPVFGFPPRDMP